MNKKIEIGARLKEFAKKKFDGIAGLERAIGKTPAFFQNYLNGRSYLGGEILAKLSELGCDINWLLNGDLPTAFVTTAKGPNREYMTAYSNLLKEGNILREENRDLKALIFDLQRDKEHLLKQNEKLTRIIQDLKDEIAELQKGMGKSPI